MELEDDGFCAKRKGGANVSDGTRRLGDKRPNNTSGGLGMEFELNAREQESRACFGFGAQGEFRLQHYRLCALLRFAAAASARG